MKLMTNMSCLNTKRDFKFKIILLDDREIKFTYKSGQKCHTMLTDVAKYINLIETEYFSFRFVNAELQSVWLDLTDTFHSQFKSIWIEDNEIVVNFHVKYYVPDPCKLTYELTRYLFYLQLRKDILNERLVSIRFDDAVELFAFFLQSELGDYNPKRDAPGYASEFQFMRGQSIEIEKSAEVKHMKLKGTSPQSAEMSFLNKVNWIDMYGVDSYQVRAQDGTDCEFQLTPTGINVVKNNTKVSSFFWPRISRVDFKAGQRRLVITVDELKEKKTLEFVLKSKSECKHLWKTCVDQHKFFKIKTVYDKPAKLSTNLIMSKKSSSNLNGGTSADVNKQQSYVWRIPARRVPRRPDEMGGSSTTTTNQDNRLNHHPNEASPSMPGMSNEELLPSPSVARRGSYSRRRESAGSENDGLKRRHGRSRRSYSEAATGAPEAASNKESSDWDNNNENQNLVDAQKNRSHSASRRRHHRSSSRGSNRHVNAENQWPGAGGGGGVSHHQLRPQHANTGVDNKSRRSLTGDSRRFKSTAATANDSYHETDNEDEDGFNEAERRRQIRRRKRSKSPGGTVKPPEEILQHINYNLVQTNGFSADQLREIPFVKVETSAPPFRISPHQKHRRYSPKRRKSSELQDSKASLAFIRDGTAQVVKTAPKPTDRGVNENVMINVASKQSTVVSTASAINTKLFAKGEPLVNIGFSADSGCEEMNIGYNTNSPNN